MKMEQFKSIEELEVYFFEEIDIKDYSLIKLNELNVKVRNLLPYENIGQILKVISGKCICITQEDNKSYYVFENIIGLKEGDFVLVLSDNVIRLDLVLEELDKLGGERLDLSILDNPPKSLDKNNINKIIQEIKEKRIKLVEEEKLRKQKELQNNKDYQKWVNESKFSSKNNSIEENKLTSVYINLEAEENLNNVFSFEEVEEIISTRSYLFKENIKLILDKLIDKGVKFKATDISYLNYSRYESNVDFDGNVVKINGGVVGRNKLYSILKILANKQLTKEQIEGLSKMGMIQYELFNSDKILVGKEKDYMKVLNNPNKDYIEVTINPTFINTRNIKLEIFGKEKEFSWKDIKKLFIDRKVFCNKFTYSEFYELMVLMEIPKSEFLEKLKTEKVMMEL